MPSARGIRAGRAFVELFADDSKLVRGLRRAEKRLKAFGDRIRNFGLKIAGLGTAMLTPMLGAAKAFSSMGDQVAKMANASSVIRPGWQRSSIRSGAFSSASRAGAGVDVFRDIVFVLLTVAVAP